MPNGGFPEVREKIAKKVNREQGVNIDGSHVIMSCGAAGALNVVFKSILNPGDEVLVNKPYFMEYRPYTLNHGGIIVEAETLPDFNLDIEAIKKKLSPKTAAVLINSPNNPTGRIYPRETIAALAAALNEHGKNCGRYPYLVSDEPYRELSYDGIEVPPILSSYSESIVVYSYSKSLSLPGERIGFIAVNPEIMDRDNLLSAFIYATRILGYVNAPALMQRITAEMIDVRADISTYTNRRNAFCRILDEAGIEYIKPEGAFYLFCKVPPGGNSSGSTSEGDDLLFTEKLKNNLILGVPGSGFGMPCYFRLAYCVDEKVINASRDAFLKTVKEWTS